MKKLGLILLGLVFCFLPVFPQSVAQPAVVILDGRAWQEMTVDEKTAYVVGFASAFQAVNFTYGAKGMQSPLSSEFTSMWQLTVGETVHKLDLLYSDLGRIEARMRDSSVDTLDCPVWLAILMAQKKISASLGDGILKLIDRTNAIRYPGK